jgi:hypothetical protein
MGSPNENVIFTLKKFWDKKPHPTFDQNLSHHLNMDVRDSDLSELFIQYLGEDELIERLDNITNKYSTWSPINSCGTYEFDFVLRTFEIDYDELTVNIYINVKLDGSVVIDGEYMSLKDALDNEDYGWEVNNEIKDCVYEKIYEVVKDETSLYTSIQFN